MAKHEKHSHEIDNVDLTERSLVSRSQHQPRSEIQNSSNPLDKVPEEIQVHLKTPTRLTSANGQTLPGEHCNPLQSNVDDSERLYFWYARHGAWVFGAVLMVGFVLGFVLLVTFWAFWGDNDIRFRGNEVESLYSINQVALHNSTLDCWVIYHENVYEMTDYASQHPGGDSSITNGCGRDNTDLFSLNHPDRSILNLIESQMVGTLVEEGNPETTNPVTTLAPGEEYENDDNYDYDDHPPEDPDTPLDDTTTDDDVVVDCEAITSVTSDELTAHGNVDDCWVAYLGSVYDMTDFISEHKGGPVLIRRACGTDDTEAFLSYHDEDNLSKVDVPIVGILV